MQRLCLVASLPLTILKPGWHCSLRAAHNCVFFSFERQRPWPYRDITQRTSRTGQSRKQHILCSEVTSQGVYVSSRVLTSGLLFLVKQPVIPIILRLLLNNKAYPVTCRYFSTILGSDPLVAQWTWLGTFKIFLTLSENSYYCPQAERTKDISWDSRDINNILDKSDSHFLHSQNLCRFFLRPIIFTEPHLIMKEIIT